MNLADVQVELRDVWGREIRGAEVDVVEKPGRGGSHWRAEVTKPGYLRDGVLLDFRGKGVEPLVLLMDPESCECPKPKQAQHRMLQSVMRHTRVAGDPVSDYVIDYEPRVAHEDRCWYECGVDPLGVRSPLDVALSHSRAFDRAPGTLHKAPQEFASRWAGPFISFKGTAPRCSPQFTFYRARDGSLIVEPDVDLAKGVRHLYDALIAHPLTGQPDARIVAQLLVLYTGIPMGFEMRVRT